MRAIQHAQELRALAAARTLAAGLQTLESRAHRQRLKLVPYILPVGTACRVSYKYSSTVRQLLKSQIAANLLPTFTAEIYVITARHSGPGRSDVWLYDLELHDVPDGQQGAAVIGNVRVQLPATLRRVDRRHLMPLHDADAVPSLGSAYPGQRYAHSLFASVARRRRPDEDDDYGADDGEDDADDEYDEANNAALGR